MNDEVKELSSQLSLVTEQLLELTAQLAQRDQLLTNKEKDLDVLRKHLLEIEEQHTSEILLAQSEIDELKSLVTTSPAHQEFLTDYEEQSREVQSLRHENQQSQQRLDALTRELETVRKQALIDRREGAALQETFSLLQEEVKGLKLRLVEAITEGDQQRLQVRQLQEQLEAERVQHANTIPWSATEPPSPPRHSEAEAEWALAMARLKADNQSLTEQNQQLKAQQHEHLERLRQTDELMKEQMEMMTALTTTLDQIPLLTEENQQYRAQVARLTEAQQPLQVKVDQLSHLVEENQRLQAELQAIPQTWVPLTTFHRVESSHKTLLLQLEAAQTQIQQLQGSLASAPDPPSIPPSTVPAEDARYQALSDRLAALQAELATERGTSANWQRQYEESQRALLAQQEQLTKALAHDEDINSQLSVQRMAIHQLTTDLQQAQQAKEQLVLQYQQSVQEKEQLVLQHQQSVQEKEQLVLQHQQSVQEKEQLDQQLQEKEQLYQHFVLEKVDHTQALMTQHSHLVTENNTLRSQIEALSNNWTDAQAALQQLQAELESSQNVNHATQHQLQSAQQQLETFQTQQSAFEQLQRTAAQDHQAAQERQAALELEITRLKTHAEALPDVVALDQQLTTLRSLVEDLEAQVLKKDEDLRSLREHLLEMEERQTSEMLRADDRITELETSLAAAQQQERDAWLLKRQVETLETELAQLKKQFTQKESELLLSQNAVANLQSVLETFQAQNEITLEAEIEHTRRQLREATELADQRQAWLVRAQSESETLRQHLEAAQQQLSSIPELQGKLEKAERQIASLNLALDEVLARLSNTATEEQNHIDKRLARQLVVSYLQNQRTKRAREFLMLLARMLGFSDEEKISIGLMPANTEKRWLSGWWNSSASVSDLSTRPDTSGAMPPLPKSSSSSISINSDASLTDLWLEFLLREAQSEQS